VNGDNVIGYGTFCEHTLKNLLEWNGENGRNYFFQSELPYDVDHRYNDDGYVGYKVADNVQNHEAWGTGVYTFFRDNEVWMNSGIKAPTNTGVKFHNSFSRFLTGSGGIKHIIDDQGSQVDKYHTLNY
jgi:predicted heme/steroid binding protein